MNGSTLSQSTTMNRGDFNFIAQMKADALSNCTLNGGQPEVAVSLVSPLYTCKMTDGGAVQETTWYADVRLGWVKKVRLDTATGVIETLAYRF
jgi:hypothetical protein